MCRNVTPQTTTSGVLLVGQRVVYYVADEAVMDDNYTQVINVIESNCLPVANILSLCKFLESSNYHFDDSALVNFDTYEIVTIRNSNQLFGKYS